MAFDLELDAKVNEWLQFIDSPMPATADEILRIEVQLDHFASLRSILGPLEGLSVRAGSPTPPRSDQYALRKQITARFPMLGLYNIPERVTDRPMQCGLMLGDAIDDILDITNELRATHWFLEQGHTVDAHWHFDSDTTNTGDITRGACCGTWKCSASRRIDQMCPDLLIF